MGEIERNRDAGHAVGAEPLVRQPEMRPEVLELAPPELTVKRADVSGELGAFDLERQVGNANPEELLRRQVVPASRDAPGDGAAANAPTRGRRSAGMPARRSSVRARACRDPPRALERGLRAPPDLGARSRHAPSRPRPDRAPPSCELLSASGGSLRSAFSGARTGGPLACRRPSTDALGCSFGAPPRRAGATGRLLACGFVLCASRALARSAPASRARRAARPAPRGPRPGRTASGSGFLSTPAPGFSFHIGSARAISRWPSAGSRAARAGRGVRRARAGAQRPRQ